MAKLKPQSLTLATHDGRLRIEFHWQEDRFVQTIFVDSVAAGNSVEGSAEDCWPSSPPLQQLSLEEINESKVILGVGAAGRGHWSISVEIDQGDEQAETIKFDLACRCKEQPPFLGSTYRLEDTVELVAADAVSQVRDGLTVVGPEVIESQTYRWAYKLRPT